MSRVEYLQKDSDDFLFGISLAELIIMLFFILLLLFLYTVQVNTEKDSLTATELTACGMMLRKAEDELAVYRQSVSRSSISCESDLIIMTRNMASVEGAIKQQREKIRELEETNLVMMEEVKESSNFDDFMEQHKLSSTELPQLSELFGKLQSEGQSVIQALDDLLIERKQLETENQDLNEALKLSNRDTIANEDVKSASEKLNELLSMNEDLESENLDCLARIESQKNRCGLDYPACWERENGQPDYIFNVTVSNTGYEVRKAYTEARNESAIKIPGVSEMQEKELSVSDFSRYANSVFKWSKERNCRHYVRVYDTPETTKATYKVRLRRLQNYFYKYEP